MKGAVLHFCPNVTGRKMSLGRCLSSFKWQWTLSQIK